MLSRRGLLQRLAGGMTVTRLWPGRLPNNQCPVCYTMGAEPRFALAKLDIYWCARCGNLWGLEHHG